MSALDLHSPAELERFVRDALMHLYDRERLETHALTHLLSQDRVSHANVLHVALVEAIEAR